MTWTRERNKKSEPVADSFQSFYQSDLQGLYALWIVPAIFLGWLAYRGWSRTTDIEPAAAEFVRLWAIIFAIETMLDPFVTGPLVRWLEADAWFSAFLLPFVLLGDFRVFVLVFYVAEPGRGASGAIGRAAIWTLIVPIVAGGANALLAAALGGVPGQTLWLLYELSFTAVALILRQRWLEAHVDAARLGVRRYLRAVLAYVLTYYLLWAAADAMILFGGLDSGWGLRVIPNQLYYSFWIPFAFTRFFRRA